MVKLAELVATSYDSDIKPIEGPSTPSDWLLQNIAHPFANALAVDPWNRLSGTVSDIKHDSNNQWEKDLYKVGDNSDSVTWAAQAASATFGTMLKYVIVGGLAAEGMRSFGAARNVTGTFGAFLRSDAAAHPTRVGPGCRNPADSPGHHRTVDPIIG